MKKNFENIDYLSYKKYIEYMGGDYYQQAILLEEDKSYINSFSICNYLVFVGACN